jgi:hypothetical protein
MEPISSHAEQSLPRPGEPAPLLMLNSTPDQPVGNKDGADGILAALATLLPNRSRVSL